MLSTLTNAATAPLNEARTFASTTAFVTAARDAVSSNALHLVIRTPDSFETGTTNAFTRIHSDDSATPAMRPRLRLTGAGLNPAPTIDPGIAPSASTGKSVALTGVATGATATIWSLASGPGSAVFVNSSNPATSVTFSAPGSYVLRLSASNVSGETSRTLAIDVIPNAAIFNDWQQLTWPGETNTNITAPDEDPDGDGLSNLLEWALHLNANVPDTLPASSQYRQIVSNTPIPVARQLPARLSIRSSGPTRWATTGPPPVFSPIRPCKSTAPASPSVAPFPQALPRAASSDSGLHCRRQPRKRHPQIFHSSSS